MKVYVDELPKSCGDCVFCKQTKYYYYCDKLHTKLGYIDKDKECPLQSLSDYTKQVRKEVCEDIRQEVKKLIDSKDFKLCNHEYANGYCYGLQYALAKILDQIQGKQND